MDNNIKLQLVQQEKDMWTNTRELLTIRYRVNKRLENKEAMDAVEKELVNCEKALTELDEIEKELKNS